MTDQHIQQLTEIIQSRQSLYPKQYTGETIDKDAIEWILNNAIHAPTHRKVNPWRFHVFSGASKTKVTSFFQETYKKNMPQERFNENKYNGFAKNVDATSHIIALTMIPNEEKPLPEWENVAALACAVQNMYLSVTAAGLGGYWSSPGLMLRNIEQLIHLDKHEACFGFFYIGVPKEERPPLVDKGDLHTYATWH